MIEELFNFAYPIIVDKLVYPAQGLNQRGLLF